MVTMRNCLYYVLVHLEQFIKIFWSNFKKFSRDKDVLKDVIRDCVFQPLLVQIIFGVIELRNCCLETLMYFN